MDPEDNNDPNQNNEEQVDDQMDPNQQEMEEQ